MKIVLPLKCYHGASRYPVDVRADCVLPKFGLPLTRTKPECLDVMLQGVSNLKPNIRVRVMYTIHRFLQVLVICGQELQAGLQKSRHKSSVAPGGKLIVGGTFVVLLHLQVTLNCNSDTSENA
jgi:hypothetical protein